MSGLAAGLRDPAAFIRANTEILRPPLVPELRLHLASEITPIWQLTEDELAERGLPPPFWAFAWAGGQALARYVLDNPQTVAGHYVLDFAAGSGLVAIAAARAGAAKVTANDIDPFAATAIALNAALNGVDLAIVTDDLISSRRAEFVVLVGDACYERPLADRLTGWLVELAASGASILIGDPGRAYLPRERLEKLAEYEVVTTRELEDREIRRTGVWRLGG